MPAMLRPILMLAVFTLAALPALAQLHQAEVIDNQELTAYTSGQVPLYVQGGQR